MGWNHQCWLWIGAKSDGLKKTSAVEEGKGKVINQCNRTTARSLIAVDNGGARGKRWSRLWRRATAAAEGIGKGGSGGRPWKRWGEVKSLMAEGHCGSRWHRQGRQWRSTMEEMRGVGLDRRWWGLGFDLGQNPVQHWTGRYQHTAGSSVSVITGSIVPCSLQPDPLLPTGRPPDGSRYTWIWSSPVFKTTISTTEVAMWKTQAWTFKTTPT